MSTENQQALIIGGHHNGEVVPAPLRNHIQRYHEVGGPQVVPRTIEEGQQPCTTTMKTCRYRLTQFCSAYQGEFQEYTYFYVPDHVSPRIEGLYLIRELWANTVAHVKLKEELDRIGYYD